VYAGITGFLYASADSISTTIISARFAPYTFPEPARSNHSGIPMHVFFWFRREGKVKVLEELRT
jgi:hypothetical protein